LRIAFQGVHGAYSEAAAERHFGRKNKFVGCYNIADVFNSVECGDADLGFVPVENSIEGPVTQTYDSLVNGKLFVAGESIMRISHCLIGFGGKKPNDISGVYSHPQALAQCSRFIHRNRMVEIPFYDTAASAKHIKEERLKDFGAIASERAASAYGLSVIKKDIENDRMNYTRFFAISREEAMHDGNGTKSSFAFVTTNKPGALYNAIGCFVRNGINMTYLQSRPIIGKPWNYIFYAECEGSMKSRPMSNACEELAGNAKSFRFLGSYAKAKVRA
jgi:prephenate dehydratase